jgi:hypothetical protein
MSSVGIHLIHARPRAKGDKEFSFFTGRSRQCLHTGLSVAHAGAIFMNKNHFQRRVILVGKLWPQKIKLRVLLQQMTKLRSV